MAEPPPTTVTLDEAGRIRYPPATLTAVPWLPERTILFVVHGSRAYGTWRASSDYDYKGVAIAPLAYYLGFAKTFEQAETRRPIDAVVFDLRKFFTLAADCNPNILEVIWADEDAVVVCTEQGRMLRAIRQLFLSRRALHRFRGYAMAQLKRIRTHRRWLLDPPAQPPTRQEFGLPDRTLIPADQLAAATAEVKKQLDSWEIDFGELTDSAKIYVQEQITHHLAELRIGTAERFQAAARLVGFDENFIAVLDRERQYTAAQRNWEQYQRWKAERNPARAELEAKYGYDCKHGMHLVRLLRMCREVLEEGIIRVRRPDAAELSAIRDGAWPFERLMEWATEQDAELVRLAERSALPRSPDLDLLDQHCRAIIESLG